MGTKITENKAKELKIINLKKGSANVTPDINTEEFDWISLDNMHACMLAGMCCLSVDPKE